MNKQEAIETIRKIQSGKYNRHSFPDNLRGRMATRYWYDSMFAYGMEYGAIHGLTMAFEITAKDLMSNP